MDGASPGGLTRPGEQTLASWLKMVGRKVKMVGNIVKMVGGESHLRSSGCSSESHPQSVGRGGSGGVGGGWKLEEVGGGWKSL